MEGVYREGDGGLNYGSAGGRTRWVDESKHHLGGKSGKASRRKQSEKVRRYVSGTMLKKVD